MNGDGDYHDPQGVRYRQEVHENGELVQFSGTSIGWFMDVSEHRNDDGTWKTLLRIPGNEGFPAEGKGASREEAIAAALLALGFRLVQGRPT